VLKYFPLQKPFLGADFTKSGISLEGRVDLMTWRFESAKKHAGLVKLDLSSRIWGATLSPEHVINTLCTTINIAFVHIFT
jgi:hypothetical protein